MNENADIMATNCTAADAALAVWLEMWNCGGFQLHRIRHLEITGEVFPGRDPAVLDADLSRWRTRRLG